MPCNYVGCQASFLFSGIVIRNYQYDYIDTVDLEKTIFLFHSNKLIAFINCKWLAFCDVQNFSLPLM